MEPRIVAEMRNMRAEFRSMGESTEMQLRLEMQNMRKDMDLLRGKLDAHAKSTESRLAEVCTELECIKVDNEIIGMGAMESTMNRMKAGTDAEKASVRTVETAVKALAERNGQVLEAQLREERTRKRKDMDVNTPRLGTDEHEIKPMEEAAQAADQETDLQFGFGPLHTSTANTTVVNNTGNNTNTVMGWTNGLERPLFNRCKKFGFVRLGTRLGCFLIFEQASD